MITKTREDKDKAKMKEITRKTLFPIIRCKLAKKRGEENLLIM